MEGKPVPECTIVPMPFVHTPPPFMPPPSLEEPIDNKLERAVRPYPKPFPPPGIGPK